MVHMALRARLHRAGVVLAAAGQAQDAKICIFVECFPFIYSLGSKAFTNEEPLGCCVLHLN